LYFFNNLYFFADEFLKNHKDINKVIISGSPFEQFYFGYLLKIKHPHIMWYADYRDDWNTSELKDKNIDEVDFIELEYGTVVSTFANIKSYSVDVKTKTFKPIYYTQEELDDIKAKQEAELKSQQLLNERTSTITNYLNIDSTSISDIEKYILQREKTKIIGGIQ
jgi:hypothetical protein